MTDEHFGPDCPQCQAMTEATKVIGGFAETMQQMLDDGTFERMGAEMARRREEAVIDTILNPRAGANREGKMTPDEVYELIELLPPAVIATGKDLVWAGEPDPVVVRGVTDWIDRRTAAAVIAEHNAVVLAMQEQLEDAVAAERRRCAAETHLRRDGCFGYSAGELDAVERACKAIETNILSPSGKG